MSLHGSPIESDRGQCWVVQELFTEANTPFQPFSYYSSGILHDLFAHMTRNDSLRVRSQQERAPPHISRTIHIITSNGSVIDISFLFWTRFLGVATGSRALENFFMNLKDLKAFRHHVIE